MPRGSNVTELNEYFITIYKHTSITIDETSRSCAEYYCINCNKAYFNAIKTLLLFSGSSRLALSQIGVHQCKVNPTLPLERVTPLRELPACSAPDVFLRVTVKLPRLSGFIVLPHRPVFARCNMPIGREEEGMKLVSTGNVELISVALLSPRSTDKRFRGVTLLFRFNVSYNWLFLSFFFFWFR